MTATEENISIPIRQYIKSEIEHLDDKYEIIQEKNAEAIKKSELSMERRLEGMNEFRAQIKNEREQYITRKEYELKHQLLIQKVDILTKLIYIGVGGVIVAEIIVKLFFK